MIDKDLFVFCKAGWVFISPGRQNRRVTNDRADGGDEAEEIEVPSVEKREMLTECRAVRNNEGWREGGPKGMCWEWMHRGWVGWMGGNVRRSRPSLTGVTLTPSIYPKTSPRGAAVHARRRDEMIQEGVGGGYDTTPHGRDLALLNSFIRGTFTHVLFAHVNVWVPIRMIC